MARRAGIWQASSATKIKASGAAVIPTAIAELDSLPATLLAREAAPRPRMRSWPSGGEILQDHIGIQFAYRGANGLRHLVQRHAHPQEKPGSAKGLAIDVIGLLARSAVFCSKGT